MNAPPPGSTAVAARYWEAMRAGRLELQRCCICRRWIHFPDVLCPACGSAELAFEPAAAEGVLETFTVVHRVFVPGFEDRAPYAVGWVALDLQPGLRVFADLVGVPAARLRIGQRLRPVFTPREGGGQVLSYTTD